MSLEGFMHKAKTPDGRANLCGERVAKMRKAMRPKCSQKKFAERLQLLGLDVDKNAIQRLEAGKRTVTDIELKIIAKALDISVDELIGDN